MSAPVCGQSPPMARVASRIEIVEPAPADCLDVAPPEGNNKLRNYRLLGDTLRAYTPTGDVHTSPEKCKLVPKFEVLSSLSPPRARILALLRPSDPGRDALEAIVRPAPRRGLARPLDDDTRRFLQRALLSPSPQGLSAAATPEPHVQAHEDSPPDRADSPAEEAEAPTETNRSLRCLKRERSLAEELREAEEDERSGKGPGLRHDLLLGLRLECGGGSGGGSAREAVERERLGRLALTVEEDEAEDGGLGAAARRLDALLAESRHLHHELATIHEDIQAQCVRACRCAAAARALRGECGTLRFLDDVVALLKGELHTATTRAWPFAMGQRRPDRSYVV